MNIKNTLIEEFNDLLKDDNTDVIKQRLPILLKTHKKLISRIDKIAKQGDKGLRQFIFQNEELRKFTKKKILEGSTTVRNVKDELSSLSSKYKAEIDSFLNIKDELFEVRNLNKEIEEKLKISSEEYDILKASSISFEELLELEIIKFNNKESKMIVAMVVINDFKNIQKGIENCTTISNFILAITNYLKETLPSQSRVMYYKSGIFNIIISNTSNNIEKTTLCKIGRIKKIHGSNIILHIVGNYVNTVDDVFSIREKTIKLYTEILQKESYDTSIVTIK